MVDNLPGGTTDHFTWQWTWHGDSFKPPRGLWFAKELMSDLGLGPVSPRKTLLGAAPNWQPRVTEQRGLHVGGGGNAGPNYSGPVTYCKSWL